MNKSDSKKSVGASSKGAQLQALKKDFQQDGTNSPNKSPDRSQSPKKQQSVKQSQDLPPGAIKSNAKADPNLQKSMSHADIKSQHKSDILKSKQSIRDKQDALSKSQVAIKELNNNIDPDAVRVTDSQQQPIPKGQTLGNNALDPMTQNNPSSPGLMGALTQIIPIDPKLGQNDPDGMTSKNTLIKPNAKNQSLNGLDAKINLSDDQIQQQEDKDNAQMALRKSQLDALQKQKPPENKEELVKYLMKRLEAAELSIKTSEEVIENERVLRKGTSKQLKTEIKDLNDLVMKEKKSLSDKVSTELDSVLKSAVKENVVVKQDLQKMTKEHDKLKGEYEDLSEMYNSLKDTQAQGEKLNEESQKIIDQFEGDAKLLKTQKAELQRSNIDATQKTEKAIKDYEEIKAVIQKLDESRFVMNKLMGPEGALNQNERNNFLSNNVKEHDQLLGQMSNSPTGGQFKALQQSADNMMGRAGSGLGLPLQNNPSRQYFNNAGIGGSTQSVNQSPYGNIGQKQQSVAHANNMLVDQAEDDDFWYQTPAAGGPTSNQGGQVPVSQYGGQNNNRGGNY